MNIRLFNKYYWVRRFEEQKEIRGYLTSPFSDFVASLHVHPTGTDTVSTNPEGSRKMLRLEGHGEIELKVSDEAKNQKGDLIYYFGDWYECVMCQYWHHTLLAHYNYQFVLVPRDGGRSTDTADEPTTDPGEVKAGDSDEDN